MNLVIKQSTSSTEVMSSSKIVETLYQLTKPDPVSGLPAANAILKGRIQVPSAYQDTVDFLNTQFSEENSDNGSDFLVSVLNNNYSIRLADPAVEEILKFAMGKDEDEGISITEAAQFNIGNLLANNVDIISFDEFPYFTYANLINGASFEGSTNLERINLSNCTKFRNFKNCSSLEYFNGPNSESGVLTIAEGTTSIGDYNFAYCQKLTEVHLPDSLTSIRYRCFEGSSHINTIYFGTGISLILECVFNITANSVKNIHIKDLDGWLNCKFDGVISNAHHLYLDSNGTSTEITSIDFTGRTTIGQNSLGGDSYITSVTIPNTIISVGSNAFIYCSGLTAVYIFDLAAWYNIIFDNELSNPLYYAHHLYLNGLEITSITIPNNITLIKALTFAGGQGIISITIPNNITSIGDGAFRGTYITSITVPNSVTSMGIRVFNDCTLLTSALLSDNVTEIKEKTFDNCPNLESVTISNNVTAIGNEAFRGCTNLKMLNSNTYGVFNIPNTVTSIGQFAFKDCRSLTSITIPNSVTSIEQQTFQNCSGLTSVTIGNSVTSIGQSAFAGCSGLTSVTIGNSVTSIGQSAFAGCSGLTSITIPNSVTSIGQGAFTNCRGMTSITIGNSVEVIKDSAFRDCDSLSSITIPSSVTTILSWAFYACNNLTSIIMLSLVPPTLSGQIIPYTNATFYVPSEVVETYKSAEGWSEYASRILAIPSN